MRAIFLGIFIIFSQNIFAEEKLITLTKSPNNIHDVASIQRGAKTFATICMACHTLIYLRYDKIAAEAGITYDKMPIHVTTWPLNVKPPDLSLEASVRGVDWIYTYLNSFYVDPQRPTGFNNLLNPNTAMPDILVGFRGMQTLVKNVDVTQGVYEHSLEWYDALVLKSQGSMTPAEYDRLVTDVVNFLAYAAEPFKTKQERLGYFVLGFLVILWLLMILLKREYWKDIKKA